MHRRLRGCASVVLLSTAATLACDADAALRSCQNALEAAPERSLAPCREAYQREPSTEVAGHLSRALASAGGHDDEVASLAARHGSAPDASDVLYALGAMHAARDEPDAAIAACRRARARRKADDFEGRARDATCLYQQLHAREQTSEAIAFAAEAYELAHRVPRPLVRSQILLGVASLFYAFNDLHTFELLLTEAEQSIDRTSAAWPKFIHLRGLLAAETGRNALARSALEEAVDHARRAGNDHSMRVASVSLAWLDLDDGHPEAARARLARIATLARDDDARTHHAYMAARIELRVGAFAEAATMAARAQQTAPAHWLGTLRALEGRARLRAGQYEPAEVALRDAMLAAEARRADMELDALRSWVLSGEWREPFEDLFTLYAHTGRSNEAFDVAERVTARSVLDGLLSARSAPPAGIALQEAALTIEGLRTVARAARSSSAAEPLAGAALRTALGRHFLLLYFRSDDALWLVRVAPNEGVRLWRVAELSGFERDLDAFRRDPEGGTLAALGATLLPAGTLPSAGETLYVVDDALGDLPFGALRVEGAPLIARHAVASIPSANVLARRAGSRRVGAPVVLGDPTEDLPSARAEAADVARAVSGSLLLGSQATRAQLLSSSKATLLHIAAHTAATPRAPGLLLADGQVLAGEILDRGVAADTVVLTACAAGERQEGEELNSLVSAFLAAGSRAVVAPRWAVEDAVAHRFTRAFYAADGARHPIRAVAVAQRKLIQLGEPVQVWAAFAAFGHEQEEQP